ncbi:G2/mitotic-specific cyclin-B1 [Tyto alba]|uniref:G2/mitotic-specific cyclin-B1 n=1 Tax=Tyto alba TaxID=56313 RepID=UPI001C6755EA|nr:G2/mitotic-specific cyclin-B1 [Tyto alba]
MATKMKLESRTVLWDIANCAADMKASDGPTEPGGAYGGAPDTRLFTSQGAVATGVAVKEHLNLPKPLRETSQLEHQLLNPVKAPGCAQPKDCAIRDDLLGVQDSEENADIYCCSTYGQDIYNYLKELEESQPVRPRYLSGQEINGNMRARLVDWLVKVQMKYKLCEETLYRSVAIIDHFLQNNPVPKINLQLVGVSAMFTACKYEETNPPCAGDFTHVTNNTYSALQICQMEKKILKALDFRVGHPLPPYFLKRIVLTSKMGLREIVLAKYLMELSILDYDMVHFPSSKTAAAAACLSWKLMKKWEWTPALEYYTSFSESNLLPVMQHMAKNVFLVNEGISNNLAIKMKYGTLANLGISARQELSSSAIWELAQPLVDK